MALRYHLLATKDGKAFPEDHIPDFIKNAFEQRDDLTELQVTLTAGDFTIVRGQEIAAIVASGADTSMFAPGVIEKVEDISHEVQQQFTDDDGPTSPVNALNDVILGLIHELTSYYPPDDNLTPQDVAENIAQQIQGLV